MVAWTEKPYIFSNLDLSVKTRTSLGNNSGNRDDLQRNIARQQVHVRVLCPCYCSAELAIINFHTEIVRVICALQLARCSQSGDFIVRNRCDVFDTSDRDEGSANAQRPAEAPSNEACSPIMAAGGNVFDVRFFLHLVLLPEVLRALFCF